MKGKPGGQRGEGEEGGVLSACRPPVLLMLVPWGLSLQLYQPPTPDRVAALGRVAGLPCDELAMSPGYLHTEPHSLPCPKVMACSALLGGAASTSLLSTPGLAQPGAGLELLPSWLEPDQCLGNPSVFPTAPGQPGPGLGSHLLRPSGPSPRRVILPSPLDVPLMPAAQSRILKSLGISNPGLL